MTLVKFNRTVKLSNGKIHLSGKSYQLSDKLTAEALPYTNTVSIEDVELQLEKKQGEIKELEQLLDSLTKPRTESKPKAKSNTAKTPDEPETPSADDKKDLI